LASGDYRSTSPSECGCRILPRSSRLWRGRFVRTAEALSTVDLAVGAAATPIVIRHAGRYTDFFVVGREQDSEETHQ